MSVALPEQLSYEMGTPGVITRVKKKRRKKKITLSAPPFTLACFSGPPLLSPCRNKEHQWGEMIMQSNSSVTASIGIIAGVEVCNVSVNDAFSNSH